MNIGTYLDSGERSHLCRGVGLTKICSGHEVLHNLYLSCSLQSIRKLRQTS